MLKKCLLASFIVLLVACGGGSGGTPQGGSANNGQVSVIVTDDLTLSYSEVWVTLHSIVAKSDSGDITLFSNKDGEVINLAELNGIGSLLAVASVPAGTYTSFEVTLAPEVKLVTLDGSTETHSFVTNGNAGQVSFTVPGNLVVANGAVSSFTLDFDLSHFTINADGNVVPAITHLKDATKTMSQTMAKLTGDITAFTDTGFTLHTSDGTEVNVVLNSNALKSRDDGLPLDALQVGMTVKVFGSYDPDTLTIEAIKVVLKTSSDGTGVVEVKGIVTAVADGTFTLNVKDAEHMMPASDSLDVSINDMTQFASGSKDLLAVDQEVDVKGTLETDGSLTALVIEIEGAGKEGGDYHSYAEIHGSVVSLVDNTLTLMVDKVCGLDVTVGSEYSVDITEVFVQHGTLADVIAGANVDVKGALDSAGQFHASILKIDGNHSMDMQAQLVFGTVTAIDGSSLTVTVSKSINLPDISAGDSITIAITADTSFNNNAMPVVDDMVAVHVTSDATGTTAQEVAVVGMPAQSMM